MSCACWAHNSCEVGRLLPPSLLPSLLPSFPLSLPLSPSLTLSLPLFRFSLHPSPGAVAAADTHTLVIVKDSTFNDNTAAGKGGGGMHVSSADAEIFANKFTRNIARFGAGGALLVYAPLLLKQSTLVGVLSCFSQASFLFR